MTTKSNLAYDFYLFVVVYEILIGTLHSVLQLSVVENEEKLIKG